LFCKYFKNDKKENQNMEMQQFKDLIAEKSAEEIEELAKKIKTIMTYYRCAMYEVETKFKVLNEELSLRNEHNPIETIKTRLKSMDSIQEKLIRKNLAPNLSSVENNMYDVAGIRVICSFIDDIYMLADCLLRQDDIRLIEQKDYIKNPKPNGYRSLHLIIEIPIFLYAEKKYVKVEIQLRTIAMEAWAKLEHRMRYKKNLSTELLEKTENILLECATSSNIIDEKMLEARNLIEK